MIAPVFQPVISNSVSFSLYLLTRKTGAISYQAARKIFLTLPNNSRYLMISRDYLQKKGGDLKNYWRPLR